MAAATRSSGSTRSTAPSLMASLGMPKTTQLASSWAMVRAPPSCRRFMPRAPSSPLPVSKMKLYGLGVADARKLADRDEMTPEELEQALQELRALRDATRH